MDIAFYCDKCGQHIVVDAAGAGLPVNCPNCSATLTVPKTAREDVSVDNQTGPKKGAAVWKCVKCGERIEEQFDSCWKCGTDRTGAVAVKPEVIREVKEEVEQHEPVKKHEPTKNTEQSRYPALRAICGVYSFLAWVVGIVTAIGAVACFLSEQPGAARLIAGVAVIVIGVVMVVTLLALSESIMVFLDIEENTRETASTVKRGARK